MDQTLTVVKRTTASSYKRTFRSGFEERLADQIEKADLPVQYEESKIEFVYPERRSSYRPDFHYSKTDGDTMYLEAKGKFDVKSRTKMLLVKAQHPSLDIRLIFMRGNNKLYRGSPTTYGMWADKHGFPWAEKWIPDDWLKEINNEPKFQNPTPPA